jgi:spermidine/putrescine transport system substrate-binding protein
MRRTPMENLLRQFETGRLSRRGFVAKAMALGLSWSAIGTLLMSCRRTDGGSHAADSTAAAAGELGPMETELSIYNWSDYIATETVPNFEKEFGVRVNYRTYESNEELVAKLQTGVSGYDLVVPSGYVIAVLAARDLIMPLHRQYLPNWGNLSSIFLGLPSDPRNQFTVPWQWGTTGIAYRTDKVSPAPDSWSVFHNRSLAGKMTMMDDRREVIGAFLRYRGHSLNSVTPAELAEAGADAVRARDNLRGFKSAPAKADLIAGNVWVAQLWNGDTTQAKARQPNLGYVVPREGCTIWSDSLAIPRSAPHKRAAHEFMNYLLRPEVAAAISDFTGYGSPNAKAQVKVPVPYPSAEELTRLEYQRDLGESDLLWEEIWDEIRATG